MKSTDLMIGDWVYRPDCYSKVKEIRENGIIGLDHLRGIISFEELKPIPLTPEILEKNGFVYDSEDKQDEGADYRGLDCRGRTACLVRRELCGDGAPLRRDGEEPAGLCGFDGLHVHQGQGYAHHRRVDDGAHCAAGNGDRVCAGDSAGVSAHPGAEQA